MDEAGQAGSHEERSRRLKIYAAATAVLVAAALLSFLAVPRGSGVGLCSSYWLQNSKYACLSSFAVASANASVCGMLPYASADSCYSQVAEKSNDSATCSMVLNATSRYYCEGSIAEATGNYSLCGGLAEPYANECAQGIAVRLAEPSVCGAAGNSTFRQECTSVIYVDRMLLAGNPSYCVNVTGIEDAGVADYVIANATSSAYGSFLNVSAEFEAAAFSPNSTYSAKDFCYFAAAEKLRNVTLCSSIGDAAVAELCDYRLSGSANATANSTQSTSVLCSELGYGSQACTVLEMRQAIATRNATECGSLGAMSDNCYYNLTVRYNDTGYCAQIANGSERASCVSET
jgi:hypothetical protein